MANSRIAFENPKGFDLEAGKAPGHLPGHRRQAGPRKDLPPTRRQGRALRGEGQDQPGLDRRQPGLDHVRDHPAGPQRLGARRSSWKEKGRATRGSGRPTAGPCRRSHSRSRPGAQDGIPRECPRGRDGCCPADVGRRAMGLVERRVDLHRGEAGGVPGQVRAPLGESVCVFLGDRPARATDADGARASFGHGKPVKRWYHPPSGRRNSRAGVASPGPPWHGVSMPSGQSPGSEGDRMAGSPSRWALKA